MNSLFFSGMWYASQSKKNPKKREDIAPKVMMGNSEQEHWQGMLDSLDSPAPKLNAQLQARLEPKRDASFGMFNPSFYRDYSNKIRFSKYLFFNHFLYFQYFCAVTWIDFWVPMYLYKWNFLYHCNEIYFFYWWSSWNINTYCQSCV